MSEHLDEQGWGGAGRVGDGAVPHGARPVGDECLDQPAGQGLRHHGDHDPGRHHPLLPGDGDAHPHRSQDRRHHRPPTGVRHRLDHLRLRLGADRGVADGGRPRAGMVGARRHRRRARLPRARRVDRRQLRRNPTQGGLRGDRWRRRCGDRGRSHRGRLGDDRAHVAGRVRRRGLHRRLHPVHDPQGERRPRSHSHAEARRRRLGALGHRSGTVRVRRARIEHLGMAQTQELAHHDLRLLAHPLRHRRRVRCALGVREMAGPPRGDASATHSSTSRWPGSHRCGPESLGSSART